MKKLNSSLQWNSINPAFDHFRNLIKSAFDHFWFDQSCFFVIECRLDRSIISDSIISTQPTASSGIPDQLQLLVVIRCLRSPKRKYFCFFTNWLVLTWLQCYKISVFSYFCTTYIFSIFLYYFNVIKLRISIKVIISLYFCIFSPYFRILFYGDLSIRFTKRSVIRKYGVL